MINFDFWNKKKVFITGHTGFKGSWLSILLNSLGSEVFGYALKPNTEPNLYYEAKVNKIAESVYGDINDLDTLSSSLTEIKPDIVLHLAAQPLVRESYNDPVTTYKTNAIGTVNILESVRSSSSVRAFLNITTDKCYENKEWVWGYRENDPLGGHDPYSASKACSELITSSYAKSFFNNDSAPGIATARAGNVIGGGDWSNDRLIPDIFKSFEKNKPLIIRNPKSTRPWQHVLEPIYGYMLLIENLWNNKNNFSGSYNFGPFSEGEKDVLFIVKNLYEQLGMKDSWIIDENTKNPHEANYLKLDISKAMALLNWVPKLSIEESLTRTVEWYINWKSNKDAHDLCLQEIDKFLKGDINNG